jgi:hypothetical protein
MTASVGKPAPPQLQRTPMVIAPDIILDLMFGRGARWTEQATMLFDAIAADILAGNERRAYMAANTVTLIHKRTMDAAGPGVARIVMHDLLRLLLVVPLSGEDYHEALSFSDFEYDAALRFVTCRRVGAKFLVTRNDFGVKRAPVHRRTAAEVLPFFRK